MKTIIKLIRKHGWKKYLRYLKYYNKKMKGDYVDHFISFSDFYYPEDIGTTERCEMKSGRIGIYKVIDVYGIDDFGSKNIKRDFLGYKGMKLIRECTLEEFMDLYDNYLKI